MLRKSGASVNFQIITITKIIIYNIIIINIGIRIVYIY